VKVVRSINNYRRDECTARPAPVTESTHYTLRTVSIIFLNEDINI